MSNGYDHHEDRREEQHEFNAIVRGHSIGKTKVRDCGRCGSAAIINGSGDLHCQDCGLVTTKESEACE